MFCSTQRNAVPSTAATPATFRAAEHSTFMGDTLYHIPLRPSSTSRKVRAAEHSTFMGDTLYHIPLRPSSTSRKVAGSIHGILGFSGLHNLSSRTKPWDLHSL
jgi:hypothetical protein